MTLFNSQSTETSLIARGAATLLGAGLTILVLIAALDGATSSLVI